MEENIGELKTRIENKLLLRIAELENVKKELTDDLLTSSPEDKLNNENLLIATTSLLDQLKQAMTNIHSLANNQ